MHKQHRALRSSRAGFVVGILVLLSCTMPIQAHAASIIEDTLSGLVKNGTVAAVTVKEQFSNITAGAQELLEETSHSAKEVTADVGHFVSTFPAGDILEGVTDTLKDTLPSREVFSHVTLSAQDTLAHTARTLHEETNTTGSSLLASTASAGSFLDSVLCNTLNLFCEEVTTPTVIETSDTPLDATSPQKDSVPNRAGPTYVTNTYPTYNSYPTTYLTIPKADDATASFVTYDAFDKQIDAVFRSMEDNDDDVGLLSITAESIESLADVASMTKTAGDLLSWSGTTWSNIATSTLGLTTNTDFDTSVELAAILTDETGTGNLVFSASPTLTGTATLANASTTNLTVASNAYLGTVQSGTWNGTTIGVPYGGTGTTTLTGLLLGNGTAPFTATTTLSASYIEDAYLRNTGDTATGDYTFDTDTFFIDATNNRVGVGTTTPSAKLSVAGDSYTGGFINTSGTTGGYQIDGTLILQASSTNSSTLVGQSAGAALLADGRYNTALGYEALMTAASSDYNTAVGYAALRTNTTGSINTAVGYAALYSNTIGNYNTANGYAALYSNTTGNYNTANGYLALYANTTGNYNTALGVNAGYGSGSNVDNRSVIDTQMIFLGMRASRDSSVASTSALTNGIAIGYDAKVLASNQVVLGNDSITTTLLKGNVGIGTTSPSAKLDIYGTAGSSDIFAISSSTNSRLFTVTAAGNVVIHPSDFPTTFTGLVDSALTIEGGIGTNEFARLTFGNGVAGNYAGIGAKVTASGSYLYFGTSNSYASGITNEAMVIDYSGNVGIGTTTPAGKLTVAGSGNTNVDFANSDSMGAALVLSDTGASQQNGGQILFGAATGLFAGIKGEYRSSAGPAGNLVFQTRSTSGDILHRMTINYLGNVGIGTTTPSVALDVVGSIEYTGTITDVSDRRLKENIHTLSGNLEKLLTLEPVSFTMKNDASSTPQLGFIAQNVLAVYQEPISYIDPENNDYLGLDYTQLIAPTVGAVIELHSELSDIFRYGTTTATSTFSSLFDDNTDTIWHRLVTLAQNFVDGVLRVAGIEAERVKTDAVETELLCVGDICVTEEEFRNVFGGSNQNASVTEHEEPTGEEDPGAVDNASEIGDEEDGGEESAGATLPLAEGETDMREENTEASAGEATAEGGMTDDTTSDTEETDDAPVKEETAPEAGDVSQGGGADTPL